MADGLMNDGAHGGGLIMGGRLTPMTTTEDSACHVLQHAARQISRCESQQPYRNREEDYRLMRLGRSPLSVLCSQGVKARI
eukprot:8392211-Heterocapsa_arctica.AAC.1